MWIFHFMRRGRLRMATHFLTVLSLRNELDVPSSRIWACSVATLYHRMLGPGLKASMCFSLGTLTRGTQLPCYVEAQSLWKGTKVTGCLYQLNSQPRVRTDSPTMGKNDHGAFLPTWGKPSPSMPARVVDSPPNNDCCLK